MIIAHEINFKLVYGKKYLLWRIQDFPKMGTNAKEWGPPTSCWTKFSLKLHEIEENLAKICTYKICQCRYAIGLII